MAVFLRCSMLGVLLAGGVLVACGAAVSASAPGGDAGATDGAATGAVVADAGGTGSGPDGGNTGTTTTGGGGITPSPSCIEVITPPGYSPCAFPDFGCEFGADENIQCNTYTDCDEAESWSTGPKGSPTCPTPTAGEDGCPSAHPASGTSCASATGCAYPQGLCACVPARGGDAGSVWACEDAGTDCPEPRPIGGFTAGCTHGGQQCWYGGCDLPGGQVEMQCEDDGTWVVVQELLCEEDGGAVSGLMP